MWPPRQAPHVGVDTVAPAEANTSSRPSRLAWSQISCVAGMTIRRTRGSARLPRRMCAAMRRSSSFAFVQDPMNTWSTATCSTVDTGWAFDGRDGSEICGSSADTST